MSVCPSRRCAEHADRDVPADQVADVTVARRGGDAARPRPRSLHSPQRGPQPHGEQPHRSSQPQRCPSPQRPVSVDWLFGSFFDFDFVVMAISLSRRRVVRAFTR
jgi:hypothetical protein